MKNNFETKNYLSKCRLNYLKALPLLFLIEFIIQKEKLKLKNRYKINVNEFKFN